MYTSYIGKALVDVINLKEDKQFTPSEFFETVMLPLFFQEGRHLMHVANSAFHTIPGKDMVEKHGGVTEAQFFNLSEAINKGLCHMGTMVGGPALNIQAVTSGQICMPDLEYSPDDMYASWIGQATAVGIGEGYGIFINDPEYLYKIYKGWEQYREFLTAHEEVKDKQIETWNAYWLTGISRRGFDENTGYHCIKFNTREMNGKISLIVPNWSQSFFALSKYYKEDIITVYCHLLSQMNVTVGFVPINLKDIRRMYDIRQDVFEDVLLKEEDIELYTTATSFFRSFRRGVIDIKAFEPKVFSKYFKKDFKFDTEEIQKENIIIKTWIMAVLNKEELYALALKTAEILLEFGADNTKGKTERSNIVKEVLYARTLEKFIESVTQILKRDKSKAATIEEIIEVALSIETDKFYLFSTLIKYHYNLINATR